MVVFFYSLTQFLVRDAKRHGLASGDAIGKTRWFWSWLSLNFSKPLKYFEASEMLEIVMI